MVDCHRQGLEREGQATLVSEAAKEIQGLFRQHLRVRRPADEPGELARSVQCPCPNLRRRLGRGFQRRLSEGQSFGRLAPNRPIPSQLANQSKAELSIRLRG